ncbi:3-hydroxyacyl-CoA dehydrogenase NAD-binding domain-containing protein [Burkholderia cenocepacia]|uniref:3-hydroxyacyl-CoA dehydrogenase NAD-binding domain-containing protein n=1 Tax=Burkholderia cenocepacia TaxID=95486 RepID=UPI0038CC111F
MRQPVEGAVVPLTEVPDATFAEGIMGPGIAAVMARAGAEVRVYDISEEALERAQVAYGRAPQCSPTSRVPSTRRRPCSARTSRQPSQARAS